MRIASLHALDLAIKGVALGPVVGGDWGARVLAHVAAVIGMGRCDRYFLSSELMGITVLVKSIGR